MKRRSEDENFGKYDASGAPKTTLLLPRCILMNREKTHPIPTQGIGGDHSAWDIIIKKLDYKNQMKISQQNQRLADIVKMNAESELRKFRRQIQEDKYM